MIRKLLCFICGHRWVVREYFSDESGDNMIRKCTRCKGEIHRHRDYVSKKWRSF